MKLIVTENYEDLSKEACKIFTEAIKSNPEIVLGLATGSTPELTYKYLIEEHYNGLDFSKVKSINLDEYIGLSKNHPGSYYFYMYEKFFKHININLENTNLPLGMTEDLEQACKDYDKIIDDLGGIDLQLLGIGEDGHIAFNEPSDSLQLSTHITELAETTIEANSRFFESKEDMPHHAISMGMGHIMRAKRIVLLANGIRKYDIMKELLTTPVVSTYLPASMLLLHRNLTIIMDKEAFTGVENEK